jgi:hypothetical protein
MTMPVPSTLPAAHHVFLHRMTGVLQADQRIVAVAAAGSYLFDTMDEYSDLDLVIVVEPAAYGAVMEQRHAIAASLGTLLAAFTGEHVGEPRLLICLYGAPMLHADLKFISLDDAAARVEDPAILWDRDGRYGAAMQAAAAHYPAPSPDWLEARFWIWIHYGAGKIGRGELFEAIDFIAFLRGTVLGPLALQRAGARPQGVRKLELAVPDFAAELRATIAPYDAAGCIQALRACVALYKDLRDLAGGFAPDAAAEKAVMAYVDAIEAKIAGGATSCQP